MFSCILEFGNQVVSTTYISPIKVNIDLQLCERKKKYVCEKKLYGLRDRENKILLVYMLIANS